jgi:hypothetical protein
MSEPLTKASDRAKIFWDTFNLLRATLSEPEFRSLVAYVSAYDADVTVAWTNDDGKLMYGTIKRSLMHTYYAHEVEMVATDAFEEALRILHNEESNEQ